MFTDYATLVYDVLDYTDFKRPVEICIELDRRWKESGKKGWFGGVKTCSHGGVFNALRVLEQEGFAEKVASRSYSGKAPIFVWRKKRGGRKSHEKKSIFSRFVRPATA